MDKFKELILVLPLSISIFRIFFSQRRASVFDIVTLITLLIWRCVIHNKPWRQLPKLLIVAVCLYILSDFVGALRSDNQLWELAELRKYVHVFIGALLFTLPLTERTRKILITIFLIAAAVAGYEGIWQYFRLGARSWGSSPHEILYAETLALAWGAAFSVMLFSRCHTGKTVINVLFLLGVLLLTSGGILFSQSRGVWLGWMVAFTVAQFLYSRWKTLIFFVSIIAALSIPFYFNGQLRERAKSIITIDSKENVVDGTNIRMELWKGSFMIFREAPFLGVGSGDFEANIKRLVQEKKLKNLVTMVHAHNIYLQSLATQGLVGCTILVASFVCLIMWGIREMKSGGGIGGYIIIFSTVLTMVGGLTENNLGTTKYLAAYCFTLGLLGPIKEQGTNEPGSGNSP